MKTFKGFTLVETLVAILALTLSLGALILISARSVQQTRDAELRLQAEMLAVEGVELARGLVTTEILSNIESEGSADPFAKIAGCQNGCKILFNENGLGQAKLSPCNSVATCGRLDSKNTPGVLPDFVNSTSSGKFYRLIYVKESGVNHGNICDGRLVRSVVWYSNPTLPNPKFISVNDELRSWYTPLGACEVNS